LGDLRGRLGGTLINHILLEIVSEVSDLLPEMKEASFNLRTIVLKEGQILKCDFSTLKADTSYGETNCGVALEFLLLVIGTISRILKGWDNIPGKVYYINE
jgi:hypothetical protein